MITRFSVTNLSNSTIHLSKVASNKIEPQLILSNAKILSTYTDRIIDNKEVWISKGRIACVKENGSCDKIFNKDNNILKYDVNNNILAPGLIDPQISSHFRELIQV